MSDFISGTIYEYSYRNPKANKIRRIKMIFGYLLFAVIYFVVFSVIFRDGFIYMIPLMIILPVLILGIALFSWKYTSVEYEIQLEGDTLRFSEVYGRRDRIKKLDFSLRDVIEIAPYGPDDDKKIEMFGCDKDFLFLSSLDSPMLCTAVIKGQDKRPWVVYFDVTAELVRRIRKINPGATHELLKLIKSNSEENE